MCEFWMLPKGELILTEAAGAPEIFADGAVIQMEGTTARLVLFSRRHLGGAAERRNQVVGRVTMTRRGWEWSTTGLTVLADIAGLVVPRLN